MSGVTCLEILRLCSTRDFDVFSALCVTLLFRQYIHIQEMFT